AQAASVLDGGPLRWQPCPLLGPYWPLSAVWSHSDRYTSSRPAPGYIFGSASDQYAGRTECHALISHLARSQPPPRFHRKLANHPRSLSGRSTRRIIRLGTARGGNGRTAALSCCRRLPADASGLPDLMRIKSRGAA